MHVEVEGVGVVATGTWGRGHFVRATCDVQSSFAALARSEQEGAFFLAFLFWGGTV